MIQLIMGERLLVWILDASIACVTEEMALDLLGKGKKERDRRRLNRFRLVLVGGPPRLAFENLDALDPLIGPRIHLHVLPALDAVQPAFPRHSEIEVR